MEIKKISIGIILLIGVYYGYQEYIHNKLIKLNHNESIENVQICSNGSTDCSANGTTCGDSGSLACCSGNCNAGVCEACYKLGGPCNSDGQCCASDCAYGVCGGNLDAEIETAAGLTAGSVVVGGGVYLAAAGVSVSLDSIAAWLEVNGYTWLADYFYVDEDEESWSEDESEIETDIEEDPDADEEYEEFEDEYGADIAADSTEVLADADTAVATVTPEAGEAVFGLEDAAGMGVGEEIGVDVAVVASASE